MKLRKQFPSADETKTIVYLLLAAFKNNAIFLFKSGLAAGIVLALIAPFATPILSDKFVAIGGGSQPNIETTNFLYSNPGEETEKYTVWLKNTNNKLATDVRLTVYFDGCVIERDIGTFGGTHPQNIQAERYRCHEIVYIDTFRPTQVITFTFIVDPTQKKGEILSSEDNSVKISGDYIWEFNGRAYVNSVDIECTHLELDRGYKNTCET